MMIKRDLEYLRVDQKGFALALLNRDTDKPDESQRRKGGDGLNTSTLPHKVVFNADDSRQQSGGLQF